MINMWKIGALLKLIHLYSFVKKCHPLVLNLTTKKNNTRRVLRHERTTECFSTWWSWNIAKIIYHGLVHLNTPFYIMICYPHILDNNDPTSTIFTSATILVHRSIILLFDLFRFHLVLLWFSKILEHKNDLPAMQMIPWVKHSSLSIKTGKPMTS